MGINIKYVYVYNNMYIKYAYNNQALLLLSNTIKENTYLVIAINYSPKPIIAH